MPAEKASLRSRLQRNWVSSLGVQTWLFSAARGLAAEVVHRAADRLSPPVEPPLGLRGGSGVQSLPRAEGRGASLEGPHPRSAEELRGLITYLKDSILQLDDVKDYETVRAIDDDMYYLWKELERKMQLHRQSEARFQLREMFRI